VNATRPRPTFSTPATHADAARRTPLYRQPGILVTPESFVVAGRRFPIRDLSNLRTSRGPNDRFTARSVVVAAAVLGAVGLALAYTGDLGGQGPVVYLLLGAAALVPIALVSARRRLRPRPWELWGDFRGVTMLLFSSDQERQFGQVTRALLRAQEAERLGGVTDPVASTYLW
jgi:uncharacterized protein DUF6232